MINIRLDNQDGSKFTRFTDSTNSCGDGNIKKKLKCIGLSVFSFSPMLYRVVG